MYIYLALLEEEVAYDETVESYFTNLNIKVIKHYSSLNLLKISCNNELKAENLKFILSIELDSSSFSFSTKSLAKL